MRRSRNLDRRRFLYAAATSAAAGSMLACSRAGRRYRFLTDAEAAVLGAICDQIIPPDEDPGAVEAGVVDFIDRQLTGHYAYWREAYRKGIAEIDEAARRSFGTGFAACSLDQQAALLKERQTSSFFRMARDHTMQGFYGDPRHGGNRDFVSWRMLGVPHPPVRGRQHYDLTRS